MRSKDKILGMYEDEVSYHQGGSDANPAMQGQIFLEVLLDIRDNLTIIFAAIERMAREVKQC